ncbi:SDR family NAD(P)-dependent oxidoreductase [Rhodococcus sp. 2H158]|nr:hypothetical protein GQ85_08915 [Rhodococcus rhodochrous]
MTNAGQLVTGASHGTGRAIARRIAAEGIAVAAVSRTLRSGDGAFAGSLEETVACIRSDGGTAETVVADLGRPELDRAALAARIEATMGRRVDRRETVAGWQPHELDEADFLPDYPHFASPPAGAGIAGQMTPSTGDDGEDSP